MSLSFHIGFNGQCKEAFEFYAEYLNGTIGTMLEFKDSPVAASVTPEWQHKIVHANIVIEQVELAGGDVNPEQYQKPQGFNILLGVKSESKVKSLFEKFAIGGEVVLPPQKTFFSPCYAIVVDRFGVPWKFSCGK
ncbi:VOC family protein [Cellvibrio sp. pealriver]|uniref:VOC family protein n=1 Tax=Cellvibrio sp. pealriver TaxID=1622269 RepID=UPI00066FBE03|nr:VOC family protein [Cellvibrio sp. pealriver]